MRTVKEVICLDWEIHALQKQCLVRLLAEQEIHFGQPPILHSLHRFGECSQSELARDLGVSPATVAVSIKRMEKSGLIRRITNPDDLRSNCVTLTAQGRAAAEAASKALDAMTAEALAGFSDGECDQLIGMFTRMRDNLSNYKNKLETE